MVQRTRKLQFSTGCNNRWYGALLSVYPVSFHSHLEVFQWLLLLYSDPFYYQYFRSWFCVHLLLLHQINIISLMPLSFLFFFGFPNGYLMLAGELLTVRIWNLVIHMMLIWLFCCATDELWLPVLDWWISIAVITLLGEIRFFVNGKMFHILCMYLLLKIVVWMCLEQLSTMFNYFIILIQLVFLGHWCWG